MINTDAFTLRLQQVMDYYSESASSFAEKIGVQRSSISHLLSGRNKPSLEFILKIIAAFPEVELYWLLNGKGEFPAIKKQFEQSQAANTQTRDLFTPAAPIIEKEVVSQEKDTRTIERIVIFYSDGSFKNYSN